MNEYTKQAEDFLKKTGTEFNAEFIEFNKYFDDDKEKRDIYKITLKRGNRQYAFKFGQSINNSGLYWQFATNKDKHFLDRELLNKSINGLSLKKEAVLKNHIKNTINSDFSTVKADSVHYPVEPTSYDVLACLQKYDVGSFENFCAEFGYDEDSRKAEKIYNAVCDEYKNICTLYTEEELEKLQEIN
jgi:hypothetical protein